MPHDITPQERARLREKIRIRSGWNPGEVSQEDRALLSLLDIADERDRLAADLAEIETIVRAWHNGYDPEWRKAFSMQEPESILEALRGLAAEDADNTSIMEKSLTERCDQQAAEIERLRIALAHYGDHDAKCDWRPATFEDGNSPPCTCGLDAALAGRKEIDIG